MSCPIVKWCFVRAEAERRSRAPRQPLMLYFGGDHHSWLFTTSVKWEYLLSGVLCQWPGFQPNNSLSQSGAWYIWAFWILYLPCLSEAFDLDIQTDRPSGRLGAGVWVKVGLKEGSRGRAVLVVMCAEAGLWPASWVAPLWGFVWELDSLYIRGSCVGRTPPDGTSPSESWWTSREQALLSMWGGLRRFDLSKSEQKPCAII